MKNLLLTLLFIFPITAIAQQNNDVEISQYLQKSIAQSKTGNILLITGGGLIATGVLVAISGEKKGGHYFFSNNDAIGGSIATLGVLSALVSIPIHISSGHNKRKYLKLTPSAAMISSNSFNEKQNYAVVGLKVTF